MFTTVAIRACVSAPADALPTAPSSGAAWRVWRMTPSPPRRRTSAGSRRRYGDPRRRRGPRAERCVLGCRRGDELLDDVVARGLDLGDDPLVHAAARRAVEPLRVLALHRHPPRAAPARGPRPCACRCACSTRSRVHLPRAQRLQDGVDSVRSAWLPKPRHQGSVNVFESIGPSASRLCIGRGSFRTCCRERLGAVARTQDLREANLRRQLRPAIDRRHGEVELGAAALAGERDADRVEERLPLLPVLSFTRFAIARNASRSSSGPSIAPASARDHLARARLVQHLRDARARCSASCAS